VAWVDDEDADARSSPRFSGSGPAYFFLVMEAMAKLAAENLGLEPGARPASLTAQTRAGRGPAWRLEKPTSTWWELRPPRGTSARRPPTERALARAGRSGGPAPRVRIRARGGQQTARASSPDELGQP